MENQNLMGFQAKGIIICDTCGAKRDKGGYILRKPIVGRFCSADHARVKVQQVLGGGKNA